MVTGSPFFNPIFFKILAFCKDFIFKSLYVHSGPSINLIIFKFGWLEDCFNMISETLQ